MNRYVWIAAALVLLGTAGWKGYAAESMSTDEQAIAAIEQEWNEVFKTSDKTVLEKYLVPDFTYIDESGALYKHRSAYIEWIVSIPKTVEYTISEEVIRVYGATAVVTAYWAGKDSTGATVSSRFTDVFAKGPDGWKAVASQDTTVE